MYQQFLTSLLQTKIIVIKINKSQGLLFCLFKLAPPPLPMYNIDTYGQSTIHI
jgi:hypothetical protein